MTRSILLPLIITTILMSCGGRITKGSTAQNEKKGVETSTTQQSTTVKYYSYVVKNSYPHATDSYTQGLQYIDSQLWESTGLEGQSRLMKVDLESGKTALVRSLPKDEFGEGITILGDSIFMLTWQSNKLYIFDRKSGKTIDKKQYLGEGWGITSDGERLYMSNGSSQIAVRDRKSFDHKECLHVTLNGQPLNYLNELEWIDGKIWANIYTLDQIVIINPESGNVEGVIDLTGILPQSEKTPQTDVLNGIAYDHENKRLFVTGKNWSKLYEIEIVER